ncbi:MFS transporter [Paenibacillus sp. TRM 82003]|nr:MFS transporter [Paenibacillus sp. TRM 82003]
MTAFTAPLKRPAFRRLFAGQTMSDSANWLDFLALSAVIVYTWGYGPFALAALSVCIGLPWVFIGPWSSLRLRRLPGRTVLIACDLFRGAVLLAIVWVDSLPLLLGLVFLKHCASSIFDPVRQSAIKKFVDRSELAQASALSQLSVNATKIVAPMAGGACIALWGVEAPFWIGAVLYLLSAVVFARLPDWRPELERSGEKLSEQVKEALAYIRMRRELGVGIVFMGAAMFLVFLYDGLFVLFTQRLGLGEASLGVLMSGIGAGSVTSALIAGKWTFWEKAPLKLIARAGLASGVLIAVVGLGGYGLLPNAIWFWLPFFFLMGIAGGIGTVPYGYLLQTETTEETIGPVSAFSNALQTGMMLLAPTLGAAIAYWVGAGGVFLGAGVAMTALAWTLGRAVRRERAASSAEQPAVPRT